METYAENYRSQNKLRCKLADLEKGCCVHKEQELLVEGVHHGKAQSLRRYGTPTCVLLLIVRCLRGTPNCIVDLARRESGAPNFTLQAAHSIIAVSNALRDGYACVRIHQVSMPDERASNALWFLSSNEKISLPIQQLRQHDFVQYQQQQQQQKKAAHTWLQNHSSFQLHPSNLCKLLPTEHC